MEQANDALQNQAGANPEGTPKTYNVKVGMDANGNPIMQEVSEDELVNGYLRQQDYTKKTQELAEEKKLLSKNATQAQDAGFKGDPTDEAAVDAFLEAKGYAKADAVEKIIEQKLKGMTKAQEDEKKLQELITTNPDLKQFEGAIRKIAATDDSALEDIVVKYGFSSTDKLSKAKQRGLIGGGNKLESDKPKPVSEWTKEDWERFEKENKKASFS